MILTLTGTPQRCCGFGSRPPQESEYPNKMTHNLFAGGGSSICKKMQRF